MKRVSILQVLLLALLLPSSAAADTIGLILDVSSSMKGKREQAMREAAKLFIATVPAEYQVQITSFNGEARGASFKLSEAGQRDAAFQHIDRLVIEGATNYVAGLAASKVPPGTPCVFLSDGENNDGPAPVLGYLKKEPRGPLYTVSIEAPAAADKLLATMAAVTGGSHARVDNSEKLVEVFLGLARQLGNYRVYSPQERTVVCERVTGKVIAFGFDAIPSMTGEPALTGEVFEHAAKLPGEHVQMASTFLARPTKVTFQATQPRSAQGRLAAILRQDLLKAEMHLEAPEGKVGAGNALKVKTRFFNTEGMLVDPRNRPGVSSQFQLLNESGQEIQKVIGKPSATEPVLEATLTVPKDQSRITVKNVTTDTGFEAEQSRLLLPQKPLALTVQPAKVQLNESECRFETTLTVAPSQPITATYAAVLEGVDAGMRLLAVQSIGDKVILKFEAARGEYKGTIVVHGSAAQPLETVRIPFEATIRERSLGLGLPPARAVRVGPFLANSGSMTILELDIPSLDTDEFRYTVDALDLSNGTSVLPCAADQKFIAPTKAKPARVRLTSELANVPAGEYSGALLLKNGAREWKVLLTMLVTEPLTAAPLDFGTLEVGGKTLRSLILKNAAGALVGVRLESQPNLDIVCEFPAKLDLPPRQDKEMPVHLTVSPLMKARGIQKTTLIVRRIQGQDLAVPVQVNVVDVGKGPSHLLAAPGKILLRGKPGEVLDFEVRIKLTADVGAITENLSVAAARFQDNQRQPTSLEVVFKADSGKLSQSAPLSLRGFVLVPQRRGTLHTALTIRSLQSGTVTIPVILEIE